MATNTILLDFTVKPSDINNEEIEEIITNVLKNYISQLDKIQKCVLEDGGFLLLFTGAKGTFVTVRGFTEGLITINIEYYKKDEDEKLLDFQQISWLEKDIAGHFGCKKYNRFPPLTRGGSLTKYFQTSDERILEYDIDEVIFEETSPYQKIQILHSKTFGNMLVLDGLQNLSSRDLIYTETLMLRGKEDYSGKEIAILGGGDGALLYELLKENPNHVLMFELDELVIRACREHMRDCCGDVLDSMKGPNYEIILGDCIKSLEAMIREGKKFDYIFGDLTDVPVTSQKVELWKLNNLVMKTSAKLLKPTGRFMTHCCGVPSVVKMFEEQITSLGEELEFTKTTAFIPSFLEDWLFYQIQKVRKSD